MNDLSTAGWTTAGFLSISMLALVGLPILSQAADQDDPQPAETASATASNDDSAASEEVATENTAGDSGDTPASEGDDARPDCDELSAEPGDIRRQVHQREYDDADKQLTTLLDGDCLDEPRDRDLARFQHAYIGRELGEPETTVERLGALETELPVDDYARWLRATALRDMEHFSEAADVFGSIYDDDQSPLHFRARAQQAKTLVEAARYDDALPVLEEIVDTFPDYPRRHRILYDHATTLEELGDRDAAAEAYQRAHFEFPYKDEGQRAEQRLQALADDGHVPAPIDPEERYEQYRQLSVDKFWPLAHQLMTDLREEIRTPDGNSELENKLLQRIALNTYHSHDFAGAAEYFAEARQLYEAGHEDGFSERVIYRYSNFTLARLGRFDEARQVLEELYADSSTRRTKQAIAEFYERYGRYEEAYELFEDIYSRAQRRGWHFSYLKYKTGRFDDAHDNFERLARGARGQTQAQYRYWAARALERDGRQDEAAALFADIAADRPSGYYGLQANNRLTDLQQRQTVDDAVIAQAEQVSEQADLVFSTFDAVDTEAGEQEAGDELSTGRANPRTEPVGVEELQEPSADPALYQHCSDGDCTALEAGFAVPHYGLTWSVGNSPLSASTDQAVESAATTASGDESPPGAQTDDINPGRIAGPTPVQFRDTTERVRFNTEARIYWDGRHDSDIGFIDYQRGDMIGPSPSTELTAYQDRSHVGGLERAIDEAGELFPELQRARWLWMAGWYPEARRVIRDVALEYRALSDRSRPDSEPHELSHRRWSYHIDNRRRSERADLWGMEPDDDALRFPVPTDDDGEQQLLERQQEIYDERGDLQPLIVDALQEVGDYHMVRQFALGDTWWLRQQPSGEAARYWEMAYPRAFPEQVIPLAEEHNVNPYMIWALMLVESSFNPDSISIADALGLLQVIPRTGLKIADLFGADDFGPFDLLDEEHSIEQGIFYFSRLVRKFHGQELLAFAGYNGGPHRVSGWLDMRGHDMPLDEFVEEIPFDESRGYAKKVLRFLNIYLELYEDTDDGVYVGQNLRTDYLEQPDF